MRDIFLFWSKVVLRSDYLLTYYAIVILLCISQYFFTVSDAQALIPLYGIFSSVLTIQIITLHQRYHVENFNDFPNIKWEAFIMAMGFQLYSDHPCHYVISWFCKVCICRDTNI